MLRTLATLALLLAIPLAAGAKPPPAACLSNCPILALAQCPPPLCPRTLSKGKLKQCLKKQTKCEKQHLKVLIRKCRKKGAVPDQVCPPPTTTTTTTTQPTTTTTHPTTTTLPASASGAFIDPSD